MWSGESCADTGASPPGSCTTDCDCPLCAPFCSPGDGRCQVTNTSGRVRVKKKVCSKGLPLAVHLFIFHHVNIPAVWLSSGGWREDGRCGPDYPLEDWTPSACNNQTEDSCCSASGWCGATAEHCTCESCVNYGGNKNLGENKYSKALWYTGEKIFDVPSSGGWREDGKCGPENPLEDGSPAACNPAWDWGHCCSKWGHCGNSIQHCDCAECVNYRGNKFYRFI